MSFTIAYKAAKTPVISEELVEDYAGNFILCKVVYKNAMKNGKTEDTFVLGHNTEDGINEFSTENYDGDQYTNTFTKDDATYANVNGINIVFNTEAEYNQFKYFSIIFNSNQASSRFTVENLESYADSGEFGVFGMLKTDKKLVFNKNLIPDILGNNSYASWNSDITDGIGIGGQTGSGDYKASDNYVVGIYLYKAE